MEENKLSIENNSNEELIIVIKNNAIFDTEKIYKKLMDKFSIFLNEKYLIFLINSKNVEKDEKKHVFLSSILDEEKRSFLEKKTFAMCVLEDKKSQKIPVFFQNIYDGLNASKKQKYFMVFDILDNINIVQKIIVQENGSIIGIENEIKNNTNELGKSEDLLRIDKNYIETIYRLGSMYYTIKVNDNYIPRIFLFEYLLEKGINEISGELNIDKYNNLDDLVKLDKYNNLDYITITNKEENSLIPIYDEAYKILNKSFLYLAEIINPFLYTTNEVLKDIIYRKIYNTFEMILEKKNLVLLDFLLRTYEYNVLKIFIDILDNSRGNHIKCYDNCKFLLRYMPDNYYDNINYNLSIVCYYIPGKKSEGMQISDKFAYSRTAPQFMINSCLNNQYWYVSLITPIKTLDFSNVITSYLIPEQPELGRYYPMNPSILRTDNGFTVNLRTVNYQSGGGSFSARDNSGIIKTKNILCQYDKEFNLLSYCDIINDIEMPIYRNNILGMEDVRIFMHNGELYATTTIASSNVHWVPQVYLVKLGKKENDIVKVEKIFHLDIDSHVCQKNYLPFSLNGKIHFIYLCEPFIIYQVDENTGVLTKLIEHRYKQNFYRFRGSGTPILFDDGYLFIIHEVLCTSYHWRSYFHRFIYMSKGFVITKTSHLFYLRDKKIEYISGLTSDENNIIITYGVSDKEAFIDFYPKEYVRKLLVEL